MSCVSTKSCAFPYKETNSPQTFAFEKPWAWLHFIHMPTWNLIITMYVMVNWLVLLFYVQNVPGLLRGGLLPRLRYFLVFLSPSRQLPYNVMLASTHFFPSPPVPFCIGPNLRRTSRNNVYLSCCIVGRTDIQISPNSGTTVTGANRSIRRKNMLLQYHFLNQKSHIEKTGIELGLTNRRGLLAS
jgi:hypothetical protein